MRDGLPTLACVNAGNELIDTIRENDLGFVEFDRDLVSLYLGLVQMLSHTKKMTAVARRCRNIYTTMFSPKVTVCQIVDCLKVGNSHT
jgi:hypothetical protein